MSISYYDIVIEYLDDMTHIERSVFIYRFMLLLSYNEIASRLDLRTRYVRNLCRQLEVQRDFLPVKKFLIELIEVSKPFKSRLLDDHF